MNKVYKGYELMKAIADGEIKEGSRFIEKSTMREYIYADEEIYMNRAYYEEEDLEYLADSFSMRELSLAEFELIEEDTIDIDSIEELTGTIDIRCNNKNIEAEDYFYNTTNIVKSIKSISDKHNELIQAVKQLNKEIKSIKEKIKL